VSRIVDRPPAPVANANNGAIDRRDDDVNGEEGSAFVPIARVLALDGAHDLEEVARAVALVNGGKSAAQIDASRPARVRDPGTAVAPPYLGYAWDPAALTRVLAQTGVADARAVIETAIALDQNDRYLDVDRLLAAARRGVAHVTEGFKWSPAVLADVMQKTGIAEETALLRMAKRVDNGDRVLSEDELLRAARILGRVVNAHDFVAVTAAMNALRERDDVDVKILGVTAAGLPIDVARFPSRTQPPALRVLVTGGVHGDEPCGAGAALLLAEQLAANPAMRGDIEWVVVPVVNPDALVAGTRKNAQGDLNRGFASAGERAEVDAMRALFASEGAFDVALDLHSGKSSRDGFWVIEQTRDSNDALAPGPVSRFSQEWPVLHSNPAPYTLSEPGVSTSANPGTLKSLAIQNGARWAATVEAPGSVAYREQVLGENDVVHQMVLEARRRVG
jgi:predicted deacylase